MGPALSFTKTLTGFLLIEFNILCQLVRSTTLSIEKDKILWRMSSKGKFFTHEVYQWLMYRDITDSQSDIWWTLPIHLKIKIFKWLVVHNKILTRDNVAKRIWISEITCPLCAEPEFISHLFLKCNVAKQI
jgi:zinc-binding in reverse transcriptase